MAAIDSYQRSLELAERNGDTAKAADLEWKISLAWVEDTRRFSQSSEREQKRQLAIQREWELARQQRRGGEGG